MEWRERAIALYGRFSAGERERLARAVEQGGGSVSRDLTRRSELLVVGALATSLIDSGALGARLKSARDRDVPVVGERSFAATVAGRAPGAAPTAPLATALAGTAFSRDDAEILAAFDLIGLQGDCVGFGDRAILRTAADLATAGRTMGEVVRILARARDLAPRGRRRIVLTPAGEAALQWDDGLTSLEGQGLLALDEDHATLEDLFEAAAVAEADGDLEEAVRLYDLCARADRTDAIAPYNLGNIRLAEEAYPVAILAYQQALARDPKFVEARYNLSQALEGAGKFPEAAGELDKVLIAEPGHSDALFNLAQLYARDGEFAEAKRLYERYLALDPPEPWAAKARQAIHYCSASIAAS